MALIIKDRLQKQTMKKQYIKKVMLVGQSGTGKSCLIHHLLGTGQFEPKHYPSVGVETGVKTIQFENGEFAVVQIWDTAGKHSLHSEVCEHFYRDIDGFVVLVSLGDQNTLKSVNFWTQKIANVRRSTSGYQIGVFANKSDVQKKQFNQSNFYSMYPNLKYYGQFSLKQTEKSKIKPEQAFNKFVIDLYREGLPRVEVQAHEPSKATNCSCVIM